LGVYLYGWDRVSPRWHAFAGVVVAVSGCASGLFVVCANAWMNAPAGFRMVNGQPTDIDPIAALLNPAAFHQALHMTLAAYLSVAAAAAGIHAALLLRRPDDALHRRALSIVLPVLCVAAFLQPLSGDLSAKAVAKQQPAKLAAMEGHWRTERRAPLLVGGIPDEQAEVTRGAIELPGMLSFMAFGDFNAEVRGLSSFPRPDRPPVLIPHLAFQVMVGSGSLLAAMAVAIVGFRLRRRGPTQHPLMLRALVLVSPLGLIALEAGWVVTEVGRQPWIVQGFMRTRDAVTPVPGLWLPLSVIAALYLFLAVVVVALLKREVFAASEKDGPNVR
ncbi:MAG: cytochrome ubiquinol oxidase subunit I, partial [Candidatus Eisenbacteria bacterium]